MRKVLLFMIVNLIFTACSSSSKENTFEIYGEEKQEIIGEYTERFLEPIERDNISGYSDTDRERFENMPTSRYFIHSYDEGLVSVYDEEENLIFKEILDDDVPVVTLSLWDDYIVEVSGSDKVNIAEVETELSNRLHPGIWHVGLDIEPGEYLMTGEGHGYVQIFDQNHERVFEVIGNDYVETSSDVILKEGQKIRINGLTEVSFD